MNNAIEKIIKMTLDGRLRWQYNHYAYWTYHNNVEIYVTRRVLIIGERNMYPTNTDLHTKLYRLVTDYDSEEHDIVFEDDVTAVVTVMGW